MKKKINLEGIEDDVEEVEIVQWFVQVGDDVKAGQPLLEVLIDKANLEIEAEEDCRIVEILKTDGEIVPLEEDIAIIEV